MSAGVMFLIFVVLMLIGIPIAFCLGLASLAYIWANGLVLSMVPQKMTTSLESFVFIALPLFILAGDIMNTGGITQKLVNISKALVGRFKGGLAYVNVVVSMLFGGIQGMAAADTVAIGGLLIPAMKKEGYRVDFATAITVASSTIGAVIPPSFLFIIFGAVTGMSVASIFIGGILPGILLGLLQIGYIYYLAHSKRNADAIPDGEKIPFRQAVRYLLEGAPTLVLPAIIMGGICTGIVTTTESAVLAVVYALAYCLLTKESDVRKLGRVFWNSAQTCGSSMIILCTSSLFGYILTAERIPEAVVRLLLNISDNRIILLLIINVFLLIVGTFMDGTPAIMILAPILLPVMMDLGLEPVNCAIVICFNLIIGMITPPVGVCLFLATGISKLTIEEISKAVFPLITISIAELILITFVPFFTTWLPSLF